VSVLTELGLVRVAMEGWPGWVGVVCVSVLTELGLEDGQELYVADPTSPNSLVFRLQISTVMDW